MGYQHEEELEWTCGLVARLRATRGVGAGQPQHGQLDQAVQVGGGRPEVSESPTPVTVPCPSHWRKGEIHRFPSDFISFLGYAQKRKGIRQLSNKM